MIVLVTYDLSKPAGANEPFLDALKSIGPWWHYLNSTWLIRTSLSPKEVYEKLAPHLVPGDRVFITRIGAYWGNLPKDAWTWIAEHFS